VFWNIAGEVNLLIHNKGCELIASAGHAHGVGVSTFFLAFHLFDLTLSRVRVRRTDVVLLALTCLLMAAKLEEIHVSLLFWYSLTKDFLEILTHLLVYSSYGVASFCGRFDLFQWKQD
jgi:hypothetical protein